MLVRTVIGLYNMDDKGIIKFVVKAIVNNSKEFHYGPGIPMNLLPNKLAMQILNLLGDSPEKFIQKHIKTFNLYGIDVEEGHWINYNGNRVGYKDSSGEIIAL